MKVKLMMWCISVLMFRPGGVAAQEVKDFDAGNFKVEVSHMMPISFPSRSLSYGYEVVLRHDTAVVSLPYMGRVYQPVINDDGLHFTLPAREVSVKAVGKSCTRVEFSVRKMPVLYKFIVKAYDNGRADVMLIPSNAQSISYSGMWEEKSVAEL